MGGLGPFNFLNDGSFRSAFGAGLVSCALVAIGARLLAHRPPREPVSLLGVVVALPSVVVLAHRTAVPDGVVAGLVALAAAGSVADLRGVPRGLAVALAVPGAWLLGWHGDLVPVAWIRWAVAAMALGGGWAIGTFDRRWAERGYAPVLFAITTVGVYFTVPDPYDAIILMGSALPVALLGWPVPIARFGYSGAMVTAGLLGWVIARDGFGRQSSIVGGIACLGLLAIEPLSRGLRGGSLSALDAAPSGWRRWPLVAGAHLVFVFVASRIAGLQSTPDYQVPGPPWRGAVAPALTIVVAETAVALAAMALLRRRAR